MQPLYDNFDLIFGTQDPTGQPSHWRRGHEELLERGLLQIEPLTYIRGRTIPKQFLIVDEAQNLTPHEVKTILTRAGEGTKVVLTGDLDQIDNPYVDAASNGLTYVIEKFKDEPLAGHVTLFRGERSDLAERAATLL
jgi:PhoH-like ATPase